LAATINAMKVTKRTKETCRVVINGAGSAGIAIAKLLLLFGFTDLILCDKVGILSKETVGDHAVWQEMLPHINREERNGNLADAMRGADIFIGVSAPGVVTKEMVQAMNSDAILFVMANPEPEIMPDIALAAGAKVVGTGRSDFPNQVNNVIAFPGIFKGALEARATQITDAMKLAAAYAIAGLVSPQELSETFILPQPFDPRIADKVAAAIKRAMQE
jgi:malate dehydrogenase (oxaloacetate-decarboxylating)